MWERLLTWLQSLRRGIGGLVPPKSGTPVVRTKGHLAQSTLLSGPEHDWNQPFGEGPLDLGFDSSFITMSGVQDPPYAFFQDDVLLSKTGSHYPHPNFPFQPLKLERDRNRR